jgi:demethylmenaquinone methyltransferase / 2-methoxy-6-polyprenyl-1,4-benzoquinol methylase
MSVKPYSQSSGTKKEQVREMFDNISHSYDLLNHFLSLGIDRGWRKTAIQKLRAQRPKLILDVATGTGDFAIEAQRIGPEKVIGIDLSNGMLERGRLKIKKRGLESKIELRQADSEKLPFGNNYFDAAIVAFGVRNFENLSKGLEEISRVLKPGATFIVLEFSKPKGMFKFFFNIYFKGVLPALGRMFSKDQRAYTYLPQSVQEFPEGPEFMAFLKRAGFRQMDEQRLTFGVCSLYSAKK